MWKGIKKSVGGGNKSKASQGSDVNEQRGTTSSPRPSPANVKSPRKARTGKADQSPASFGIDEQEAVLVSNDRASTNAKGKDVPQDTDGMEADVGIADVSPSSHRDESKSREGKKKDKKLLPMIPSGKKKDKKPPLAPTKANSSSNRPPRTLSSTFLDTESAGSRIRELEVEVGQMADDIKGEQKRIQEGWDELTKEMEGFESYKKSVETEFAQKTMEVEGRRELLETQLTEASARDADIDLLKSKLELDQEALDMAKKEHHALVAELAETRKAFEKDEAEIALLRSRCEKFDQTLAAKEQEHAMAMEQLLIDKEQELDDLKCLDGAHIATISGMNIIKDQYETELKTLRTEANLLKLLGSPRQESGDSEGGSEGGGLGSTSESLQREIEDLKEEKRAIIADFERQLREKEDELEISKSAMLVETNTLVDTSTLNLEPVEDDAMMKEQLEIAQAELMAERHQFAQIQGELVTSQEQLESAESELARYRESMKMLEETPTPTSIKRGSSGVIPEFRRMMSGTTGKGPTRSELEAELERYKLLAGSLQTAFLDLNHATMEAQAIEQGVDFEEPICDDTPDASDVPVIVDLIKVSLLEHARHQNKELPSARDTDVDLLRAEIATLTDALDETNHDHSSARKDLGEKLEVITSLEGRLLDSEETIKTINEDLAQAQQDVEAARQEVDQALQMNETLKKTLTSASDLDETMAQRMSDIARLESIIEQKDQELLDLQATLEQVQAEAEDLHKSLETALTASSTETIQREHNEQLAATKSGFTTQLKALQEQLDQSILEVERNTELVTKTEAELNAVQIALKDATDAIAQEKEAFESERHTLEETSKASMEELKLVIKDHENKSVNLHTEIEELKNSMSSRKQSGANKLQETLALNSDLKSQVDRLELNEVTLNERLVKLNESSLNYQSSIKSLEITLDQLQMKIGSLEMDLKRGAGEKKRLEIALEHHKEEATKNEKMMEGLQNEYRTKLNAKGELSVTNIKLMNEIDELRTELKAKEVSMAMLNDAAVKSNEEKMATQETVDSLTVQVAELGDAQIKITDEAVKEFKQRMEHLQNENQSIAHEKQLLLKQKEGDQEKLKQHLDAVVTEKDANLKELEDENDKLRSALTQAKDDNGYMKTMVTKHRFAQAISNSKATNAEENMRALSVTRVGASILLEGLPNVHLQPLNGCDSDRSEEFPLLEIAPLDKRRLLKALFGRDKNKEFDLETTLISEELSKTLEEGHRCNQPQYFTEAQLRTEEEAKVFRRLKALWNLGEELRLAFVHEDATLMDRFRDTETSPDAFRNLMSRFTRASTVLRTRIGEVETLLVQYADAANETRRLAIEDRRKMKLLLMRVKSSNGMDSVAQSQLAEMTNVSNVNVSLVKQNYTTNTIANHPSSEPFTVSSDVQGNAPWKFPSPSMQPPHRTNNSQIATRSHVTQLNTGKSQSPLAPMGSHTTQKYHIVPNKKASSFIK